VDAVDKTGAPDRASTELEAALADMDVAKVKLTITVEPLS